MELQQVQAFQDGRDPQGSAWHTCIWSLFCGVFLCALSSAIISLRKRVMVALLYGCHCQSSVSLPRGAVAWSVSVALKSIKWYMDLSCKQESVTNVYAAFSVNTNENEFHKNTKKFSFCWYTLKLINEHAWHVPRFLIYKNISELVVYSVYNPLPKKNKWFQR